jgi:hypothetical protein
VFNEPHVKRVFDEVGALLMTGEDGAYKLLMVQLFGSVFDTRICQGHSFVPPKAFKTILVSPAEVLHNMEQPSTDLRAPCMGLGPIKQNDPILARVRTKIGVGPHVQEQKLLISLAVVHHVLASPALFDVCSNEADMQAKVMMLIKNDHTINLPMQDNLYRNVLQDTITYCILYARSKLRARKKVFNLDFHDLPGL